MDKEKVIKQIEPKPAPAPKMTPRVRRGGSVTIEPKGKTDGKEKVKP